MEKLYIGVEAGNTNAEIIVAEHIGKTITQLRAALIARFSYDPVGQVHNEQHEKNLLFQGQIIITVNDDGIVSRA